MLDDLDITIIDCQTSGATPPAGQVIELGWARCRAAQPSITPESHLIKLKPGQNYPNRIAMLTGISEDELTTADSENVVLNRLLTKLPPNPILIAHYARFERTFIEPLLPPEMAHTFLCTYEIARRLFPDLPSRSIRAVSGYLGHHTDEAKRSAHHIDATFFIWKRLTSELAKRGISTIENLTAWLAAPAPKATKKIYALSSDVRLKLPSKPGIYKMLGHDGRVLYVGKATSLRSRVNSYFRGKKTKGSRINELVSQVASIDYQVTNNAAEAALVESDAIKDLNPPYNRAQRAGNRAIGFSTSDMKPVTERSGASGDQRIFGPFGSLRYLEQLYQMRVAIDSVTDGACIDHLNDLGAENKVVLEGIKSFRAYFAHVKDESIDWRRTLCKRWKVSIEHERERRRLAAEENEQDDIETIDHEDGSKTKEEIVWTPELVASYIAGAFTSYARSLHRARWLNKLASSVLIWTDKKSGHSYQIAVERGRCLFEQVHDRTQDSYQIADLATYDRMQVYLGEIRRLLREGHALELRLAKGRILSSSQLKHYLFPGEFDAVDTSSQEPPP